jgi:16S rRNA processing protein RimM
MGHRRMSPAQADAVASDELSLGYVSGVFGYKGEVRLFLYNRKTEVFDGEGADVTLIDMDGARTDCRMRTRPGAGKRVLGRLSGITDEAGARALMGREIVIVKAVLPAAKDGEYYHYQLIGLAVSEESGTELGIIREVLQGREVDIWVVEGPDGELMLPAMRDAIVSVDLDSGVVIADGVVD